MQTITITLSVPDGVQFEVRTNPTPESFPAQSAVITEAIAAPAEAKPSGPTFADLTKAFLAAAAKCKENGDPKLGAALKAMGCAKVKDVPQVAYVEVIAALNAVAGV